MSFLTSTRVRARAKVNDFAILKFEETFYIDERGVENRGANDKTMTVVTSPILDWLNIS